MQRQKTLIFAILAALLVAVGVFSSVLAADQYTFRVVNLTHRDVRVEVYEDYHDKSYYGTLNVGDKTGDVVAVYIVPAGGTVDLSLDAGETYFYAYQACGFGDGYTDDIIDSQFKLEEDVELTITPCDRHSTVMQVKNHLGETISLELIGFEEDTFEIEPGQNIVQVFSGETVYKYDACDTDFNGVVDILANGKTQFVMHSCEWYDEPAREWGAINPVRFTIVNHASFPVILSLVGPESYLVTAEYGENPVQLVAGVYKYSYYLDYQLTTGSFFVPKHGNGRVIISPSYTIDYEVDEEFE